MHKLLALLSIPFFVFPAPISAQNATWQPLPGLYGGDITCLGQLGNAWYVGTGNGVFRSTDEGEHWAGLNWIPPGQEISGMVMEPGHFAVATNQFVIQPGGIDKYLALVYQSFDEGATWSVDTIQEGTGPYYFRLHSHRGRLIADDMDLLNSGNGLLLRNGPDPHDWTSILPDPSFLTITFQANDSLLLADDFFQPYYSLDAGDTWQLLDLPPSLYSGSFCLGVGKTVLFYNDFSSSFRTTNLGQSWLQVNNPFPSGFLPVSRLLPGNKLAVRSSTLIGEKPLYVSASNGLNWTSFIINPVTRVNDMVFSGAVWGVATPMGFFKNYPGGNVLNRSNDGIAAADVYVQLFRNGQYFAGANEALWRSFDGGNSWTSCFPQTSLVGLRDLKEKGDTICAMTTNNFFYSTDEGDSWTNPYVSGGSPYGTPFETAQSMAIQGNELLVGDYNMYHSEDLGEHWNTLQQSVQGSGVICHENNWFAYRFSNGIWRATDVNGTWKLVRNQSGIQGRFYAVDGRLYACTQHHGILISDDLGDTWTVAGGLPRHGLFDYTNPVNALAWNDTLMFAAVDYAGIYYSKDRGLNWTLWPLVLPGHRFRDLQLQNALLYASITNKGLWKLDLSTVAAVEPGGADGFRLWPNPCSGAALHITLPEIIDNAYRVYLYNQLGETVIKMDAPGPRIVLELPRYHLPTGVYFVVVSDGRRRFSQRLFYSE